MHLSKNLMSIFPTLYSSITWYIMVSLMKNWYRLCGFSIFRLHPISRLINLFNLGFGIATKSHLSRATEWRSCTVSVILLERVRSIRSCISLLAAILHQCRQRTRPGNQGWPSQRSTDISKPLASLLIVVFVCCFPLLHLDRDVCRVGDWVCEVSLLAWFVVEPRVLGHLHDLPVAAGANMILLLGPGHVVGRVVRADHVVHLRGLFSTFDQVVLNSLGPVLMGFVVRACDGFLFIAVAGHYIF